MADERLHYHQIRNIWYGVIHRVTNPDHPRYCDYGGRGITLCQKWHSFDAFYADMLHGFVPGLEIERIDNNQGYFPENCKWATVKQQANNRRSNRFFTIDGITKTLAQWIDDCGVKSSTVKQRLYVYKWPIKKALGMTKEK